MATHRRYTSRRRKIKLERFLYGLWLILKLIILILQLFKLIQG